MKKITTAKGVIYVNLNGVATCQIFAGSKESTQGQHFIQITYKGKDSANALVGPFTTAIDAENVINNDIVPAIKD